MANVNQSALAASGPTTDGLTRVWDLPTRAFHWLLAACVIGSVASAKIGGNAMIWHFRLGYVVFALLVFRIVWGVIGGRWSRFSHFFVGPSRLVGSLRGGVAGQSIGHNPLGALSVLAMLAILSLQVASGLFADDEIANSGPLVALVSGAASSSLTSWHKTWGQWLILGLIALHVATILFYLWRMKQDLITPMITGDKHLAGPAAPESADGWRQRLLALLLIGLCAALVAAVLELGAVGYGG